MEPNFLVIGAAKCATTSLCTLIGRHPQGFVCDPKEPFFFSNDRNYHRKGWSWYEQLFAGAAGKLAIGEGSTHYSQQAIYPLAASRIARDLPDTRLIYIVRNPLTQIPSHWVELRCKWSDVRPQGISVDADFNAAVCQTTPVLMETARYWKQLQCYREHFPDDRILVLFFEHFVDDPAAVLRRCFAFLGIEPEVAIEGHDQARNRSRDKYDDRWFFRPVRLLPGATLARRWTPGLVRRAVRPLIRAPLGGHPGWDPRVRDWALDQLAEDGSALLTHLGMPADFWRAPEPAPSLPGRLDMAARPGCV